MRSEGNNGPGETQPTQPKSDRYTARRNVRSDKRNRIGGTRKATPAMLKKIVANLALGLTRKQSCADVGISVDSLEAWERQPEFGNLRSKTEAARIKFLLKQMDREVRDKKDWKRTAWLLEKTYRAQFGENPVTINQQNNLMVADLDEARRILDAAKALPYRNGKSDRLQLKEQ